MNARCSQLSRFLCALFAALALLPAARAADEPTLTYRRVFKSSVPEFIEIRVPRHGVCTFDIRQLDQEAVPEPFEVGEALRAKMFQLAADLNHFRGLQLDIRRRIANLGQKTFRYEQSGESSETTFNYTLNSTASLLMQIFEGLARQQEHQMRLARRIRYDRLGVNEALLLFESDVNHRLLPEPERLVPLLQQIAADPRFVEIARQRARALIERLRPSPTD